MALTFDLKIGGVKKGSVSIAGVGAGDRTFTYTPSGGSSESNQTVSITVNGSSRGLTSVSPFSITIDSVTYSGMSGSLDITTKNGSGSLTSGTDATGASWTTDDASGGSEEDVPKASATYGAATR